MEPSSLKAGVRIRAKSDWYPARAGAIAKILHFKGMPGKWHAVVQWERPADNFAPDRQSDVSPADLEQFEMVR